MWWPTFEWFDWCGCVRSRTFDSFGRGQLDNGKGRRHTHIHTFTEPEGQDMSSCLVWTCLTVITLAMSSLMSKLSSSVLSLSSFSHFLFILQSFKILDMLLFVCVFVQTSKVLHCSLNKLDQTKFCPLFSIFFLLMLTWVKSYVYSTLWDIFPNILLHFGELIKFETSDNPKELSYWCYGSVQPSCWLDREREEVTWIWSWWVCLFEQCLSTRWLTGNVSTHLVSIKTTCHSIVTNSLFEFALATFSQTILMFMSI